MFSATNFVERTENNGGFYITLFFTIYLFIYLLSLFRFQLFALSNVSNYLEKSLSSSSVSTVDPNRRLLRGQG